MLVWAKIYVWRRDVDWDPPRVPCGFGKIRGFELGLRLRVCDSVFRPQGWGCVVRVLSKGLCVPLGTQTRDVFGGVNGGFVR